MFNKILLSLCLFVSCASFSAQNAKIEKLDQLFQAAIGQGKVLPQEKVPYKLYVPGQDAQLDQDIKDALFIVKQGISEQSMNQDDFDLTGNVFISLPNHAFSIEAENISKNPLNFNFDTEELYNNILKTGILRVAKTNENQEKPTLNIVYQAYADA